VVFDGAQLTYRALKSIEQDEEIFISYIDNTLPYSRRIHELAERYYFQCSCKRCEKGLLAKKEMFLRDPETLAEGWVRKRKYMPQILAKASAGTTFDSERDYLGNGARATQVAIMQCYAFERLELCRKELEYNKAMLNINEGIQACLRTQIWPEYRQPLASLRDEAFLKLITPKPHLLSLAFQYGWKLYFEVHPVQYPQSFHPVRVIHKWRLAMLTLLLSSLLTDDPAQENKSVKDLLGEGVDFGVILVGLFMEFQDNVKKSHGLESGFARRTQGKIDQVKIDMTRAGSIMYREAIGKITAQWTILRRLAISKDLDEELPEKLDGEDWNTV